MFDYLTGMGHFGISFFTGYIAFVLLVLVLPKVLWVRLYVPFFPFFLGFLGASPYFFIERFTCDLPSALNIFFFYAALHCQSFAVQWLGNIHFVVVVCGLLYITIILYYIHTIKRLRRGRERTKRRRRQRA